MVDLAKFIIFLGIFLVGFGVLLLMAPQIPWLGKLPGDFVKKGENYTIYFPLATCLILSMLFSLLMYLWNQK